MGCCDAKKNQRNCVRLNLHCCPHGLPGPHYAPLWLRQKLTGYQLTELLEIWVIELRTTLAPALGTHRHTAAAVAKDTKACLRSGVFNLAADMGKNVLTAIPEVVVI